MCVLYFNVISRTKQLTNLVMCPTMIYGVGMCPHALQRQTIIVCNVACCLRSYPMADINLLYFVGCQCALLVVGLRIILTLGVRPSQALIIHCII